MKTMRKLLTVLCSIIVLNSFGAATFTITSTSVPDGYVQHPYTFKLQSVNGVGAVTWSKSGGTFPQGIQLGATNGVIAGSVGTFTNTTNSFTITATDAAGSQAIRAYSFSFTNYQIANTNFVRTGAQLMNARDPNWYEYYDFVNNMYDLPAFTAGSGVTVSKPATWNGIAPTYTISATSTITAQPTITGIGSTTITTGVNSYSVSTPILTTGTYTPSVVTSGNVTITQVNGSQWTRNNNIVTVSGYLEASINSAVDAVFTVSNPISTASTEEYKLAGTASFSPVADVSTSFTIYLDTGTGNATLDCQLTPTFSGDPVSGVITYIYQYTIE